MAGPSLPLVLAGVALAAVTVLPAGTVARGRPSGGPAAVVDRSGPAAAAPRPAPGRVPLWRWPLAPVPRVVRAFAPGPHPWSPGHRGVDLAAPTGARVIAVAAGTVVFSGRVAGRGVVSVAHAGGLRSTYQPLEDLPARGPVRAGGPLGSLAAEASHCAPAACLHLGAVRTGTPLDAYLDPLTLLRPRPAPVLLPAPPPPSG